MRTRGNKWRLTYIMTRIVLVATMLTSCRSDYDWRFEKLSDYGQDFVKEFGWPNARQNWNTAVRHKVKLGIPQEGEWNVRVFTADPLNEPKKAYLLGQFNVSTDGEQTVTVDGPYTIESVCVAISDGELTARKIVPVVEFDTIRANFEQRELMPGMMVNAQKMSYFFAYEVADSTNTYLDFNDIVLEVIHVSGESTADIKLRAVGAKENIKITFQGDTETTVLYEDAHAAFGYRKPVFDINVKTGEHDFFMPIVRRNVNVGSNFSIVEDAFRIVASIDRKKKTENYSMKRNEDDYLGLPPNAFVVANPTWDWVSENDAVEKRHKAFPYWARAYHKHNTWWDTLWDRNELMLSTDKVSYHPDYDYTDMIFSATDIERNGGQVPDISYERLKPYTDGKIGANIGFSIVGRHGGKIRIALERYDRGAFDWYDVVDEDGVPRAYVDVSGANINIDAGAGNEAESCHILLATRTIERMIDLKTSLRVIFDPGETDTKINSVWIRNR